MLIDTNDLIDAARAASIIGLTSPRSVTTYSERYDDFPEPVIRQGRCVLWRRQDVELWAAGHRRQRGPEPGTPKRR